LVDHYAKDKDNWVKIENEMAIDKESGDRNKLGILPEERSVLWTTRLDINLEIRRIQYLVKYWVRDEQFRPGGFPTVLATLSNLYKLQTEIEAMADLLTLIGDDAPNESTHRRIHELIEKIYSAKRSLRGLFGSRTLFRTTLNNTDDYVDWALRKLLVQRCIKDSQVLKKTIRDAPILKAENLRKSDYDQTRWHYIRMLSKISSAWQRASMKDQILNDKTSLLQQAESVFNTNDDNVVLKYHPYVSTPAREKGKAKEPDREKEKAEDLIKLGKDAVTLRDLRSQVDERQRAEALTNPDASALLLKSAELPIDVIKLLSSLSYSLDSYEARMLLRSGRLLARASQQAIDPLRFGRQVSSLQDSLADIKRNISEEKVREKSGLAIEWFWLKHGTFPDPKPVKNYFSSLADATKSQLAPAEELVKLLMDRRERLVGEQLVGRAVENDASVPGKLSSLEDPEEELPSENALTPLTTSLQETTTSLEEPDPKSERTKERLKAEILFADEKNKDFRPDFINQLVYLEFPTLVLDILGRLRMFEDDIRDLEADFHDEISPKPVFERFNRPRAVPKFDLAAARDGSMLEIPFTQFQVEDGAEIELILGLSRPLRKFDLLRKDPPKLRLYQPGEKDDILVERPYLNFDTEVSTETMLVYRAPKPWLKAGLIGAGRYAPKLQINRKYLPILSRDETINYTFSVGTPRPNVQLIAGLRQPQPKDGDREFGKDKVEDAFRGTILSNTNEAIVEVQVLAGAPVTNADVMGRFQWIDETNNTIETPTLNFLDNGLLPDLRKDDGVYTARIALQPATKRKPAEYRVFVQASSTDKVKFIPLAEAIPIKNEEPKKEPEPPPVPNFQRATSLNFRASAEN
jgi:hypothetical protein